MKLAIEVAIGVLIEQIDGAPHILIAKRPKQAVLGGYWEFPGGKLEDGESASQCLVREFKEELGIEVRVGQALLSVEHEYPHGRIRLNPFVCTRLAGEPRNIKVTEHRWVRPDELGSYTFPPANDTLLQQLTAVMDDIVNHTPVSE